MKCDIVIPHTVKDWLFLLDRTSAFQSAMVDEWNTTFLRPFEGEEIDLYSPRMLWMPGDPIEWLEAS